jgi:hypothetical protein
MRHCQYQPKSRAGKSKVAAKNSPFATQIILYLVVVAREVEKQNIFIRLKNQPPTQTRAALVKSFAELADGQTGMKMWIAETVADKLQRLQNFAFASGIAHDFFEPFGQFNGNH